MKKHLLVAILAVSALCMRAEFNRLVFHTSTGEEQSVGLTDLNITFADGQLLATADGESVAIDLNSLSSMEFAYVESTGITDAAIEGAVTAYSAEGISFGKFESKEAACKALPGGLYIIKSETGVTSKLLINR